MIQPGTAFIDVRTLTQSDFDRFARLSGDDNPIHVDPAFSKRTRFGRTVAHGMLLFSIAWATMRRNLRVVRLDSQALMFPNPAFADQPLQFSCLIGQAIGTKVSVSIKVTRVSDGAVTCEGTTEMIVRGRTHEPFCECRRPCQRDAHLRSGDHCRLRKPRRRAGDRDRTRSRPPNRRALLLSYWCEGSGARDQLPEAKPCLLGARADRRAADSYGRDHATEAREALVRSRHYLRGRSRTNDLHRSRAGPCQGCRKSGQI